MLRRRSGADPGKLPYQAIRALLARPELAQQLDDGAAVRALPFKGVEFLADLVDFIRSRSGVTRARILEHWRETCFAGRLSQIAAEIDDLESDGVELDFEHELHHALTRLADRKEREERQAIAETGSAAGLSDEQRKRLRRN